MPGVGDVIMIGTPSGDGAVDVGDQIKGQFKGRQSVHLSIRL